MAFNETKMSILLDRDGLQLWVNSFGGSMTKFTLSWISANQKRVDSGNYYKKGCHYIKPIPIKSVKMGLYCYSEDLGIALTSQITKGYHIMNYNRIKNCNDRESFSIEHWIDLIEEQIVNWTSGNPPFPILILNTDKIWEYEEIVRKQLKLENKKPLDPKRERSTKQLHPDLLPFTERLNLINDKLKKLPDIALLLPNGTIENIV